MKFKKVWNDLRLKPNQFLLVVFALVLGIAGVGTLIVSNTVLTKDLNVNFLRTNPPHAILTSKDFAQHDIQKLVRSDQIANAEFRDFAMHRIEVKPNEWLPLLLFGVDFGDMQVAGIFSEKGPETPKPGTMLIERNGQLVSNLKIGSNPRMRVGREVKRLPISGICFDPAQAPATQDAFIYGYVDKQTFTNITSKPSNQRLLLRFNDVGSKQEVRKATQTIIDEWETSGIAIQSVNIPDFEAHPHQWQLNTLLFLIGIIGFLALIMGAVLVSQLMKSILSSQIRQIGVLKSIGATRRDILLIYVAMVLSFGVLAGIIAIPLAQIAGYKFSYFIAQVLNFNIFTTQLPGQVYGYLIAASLILPVLLSLPQIIKSTNVSVREAISEYGISDRVQLNKTTFKSKFMLPGTFILALRNTRRKTGRLIVTVSAMALGVAIFSTGFNVRQSLANMLADLEQSVKYDVQVVLNEQISKAKALAPFQSIKNIAKTETWSGGRGELQSKILGTKEGIGIVALPHDTKLRKYDVIEGRWLDHSGSPEIVINQQAWERYRHPEIGSMMELDLNGDQVEVRLVGVVKELERPKIYIDKAHFDKIANPDHKVNTVLFVAKNNDYNDVIKLKQAIENRILTSDLDVLYVMSQAERLKVIYDHLNIILITIVILSFLVLIVSAVGMASATGINIMERTREIGVMRAIGATPKIIYRLFVTEGFIVCVMSLMTGLLLAWPLSQLASIFFGNLMLGEGTELNYAFSQLGFIVTLFVTLIFSWLASRMPAKSAIKISTHKALSYE